MNYSCSKGFSLIELLVAMAVASIAGSMIMQLVISFNANILLEISRNDLQDRAERLIRFMANDISGSAFMLGSRPKDADGHALTLIHDSFAGDPAELLSYSILVNDIPSGNDQITIVKAESFNPPISLIQHGTVGDHTVMLNRRPNHTPGSTREIYPAPEAINHLVFSNRHFSYQVLQAEQALQVTPALVESVPANTEVLGVRAYSYTLDPHAGSHRLRRDDFTSRSILDKAIDGLQFEYLMTNGALVSMPVSPENIRGIKINLLVRDLRLDHNYTNEKIYSLGNQTYGPYRDHYRRYQVSRLVEVKNNGLP